tara:strand:- start:260 stop:463 length:204 start_codon:yes stop_codon:yes gene_type:complete
MYFLLPGSVLGHIAALLSELTQHQSVLEQTGQGLEVSTRFQLDISTPFVIQNTLAYELWYLGDNSIA